MWALTPGLFHNQQNLSKKILMSLFDYSRFLAKAILVYFTYEIEFDLFNNARLIAQENGVFNSCIHEYMNSKRRSKK